MATKKHHKKRQNKKWLHQYRLVVLKEDNFEEQFAFKLTPLNVFVFTTLSAIFLITLTTIFIAFTSLREYIPGYTSPSLQKKAIKLKSKTDSLYQITQMNERYITSIKKVLTGEATFESIDKDSIYDSLKAEVDSLDLTPSKADSLDGVKSKESTSAFKDAYIESLSIDSKVASPVKTFFIEAI